MSSDPQKTSRSHRNHTLTLASDEVPMLRSRLAHVEAMSEGTAAQWLDQVVCGDMREALRLMPDAMADLIIIDPPYNLTKHFGGHTFNARTEDDYEQYLRGWMHDVCLKLKPTGSLYLCGDWRCTSALQRVLSEELTIINRITWQREKGRGAARNWKNTMEDIWFAVKDPQQYYFDVEAVKVRRQVLAPYRQDGQPKDWEETEGGKYRMTYPGNFWDDISVPFWSMPENTEHPTQKPEKLIAKLILASSRPGDLVFDPFAGSGTSCVVAKKLDRHYCGVELVEEYCLWAMKRLLAADADRSIQGYSDGVFWERHAKTRR